MLEQLRSFELTNAFIDSIYFCDSGKGLVYSSAGLQYGMADFFDKEWFGYADQAFISPAVMDTRTVDFPYKGNQQVITLVFRSYYNEMNLMAVNIDARKFYDQIVLKIERKGTDSLFAYSGEGELLLKDYRYPELQQLIQRERVDAFRDGQYHWDSGKLGRKRYLLSYLESDKLGWNFVMVSDVQQHLPGGRGAADGVPAEPRGSDGLRDPGGGGRLPQAVFPHREADGDRGGKPPEIGLEKRIRRAGRRL